jgi:glyoxylase-like metal-dependent hydrolase (beta-lactamase superfamily II)
MIHMSNKTISVGRCGWITILGAAFMLGRTVDAAGEAPMQRIQVPGFYRMMLGEFEITALFDGAIDLDAGLLKNLSQAEIDTLLKRALIADPHKVATATNAYMINTAAKLVLVDTGGGATFGRGLGHLRENLAAAGYRPSQVDVVLVTHLHFDHGGGLIDAEGQSAFPNAVVYLAKAENDYWLSQEEPDVPAVYKDALKKARKLARDAAKPYIDSGRWKTFENSSNRTGTEESVGQDSAGGEEPSRQSPPTPWSGLPISGIKPVAIHGHTPGHTAYEVRSKGQTLLIIGDTVHFAAVQFARPDAAVAFDVDPKQAATTREALFRQIADVTTFVADMHAAFPGIGRLRSDGKGGYVWVPIEFSPLPTVRQGSK